MRMRLGVMTALAVAIGVASWSGRAPRCGGGAGKPKAAAPVVPPGASKATFAGGCFWCMEPPFEKLPGVYSVTSGYIGGPQKDPTYEAGLLGRDGPRGSGRRSCSTRRRSRTSSCSGLLAQRRPDRAQPPVLRRGRAVPHRRSSSTTRRSGAAAEASKAEVERTKTVQAGGRHAHRGRGRLLAGRGVSPGLLQEERHALPHVPHGLRARRAPQGAVGNRGPLSYPRGLP